MLISAERAKIKTDKRKKEYQFKWVIGLIDAAISNGEYSTILWGFLDPQNKEKIKAKGYHIEEYKETEMTVISWEDTI